MSNSVPWGYLLRDGKLVANTSQAEMRRRAILGETAIRVLGALGVSLSHLEALVEIYDPSELLTQLSAARLEASCASRASSGDAI